MRLFLESMWGEHLSALHELVGDNKTVLVILNASDRKSGLGRAWKRFKHLHHWRRAGFDPVELDLRKFFDKKAKLKKFIKSKSPGLIYAAGGNTFILRRAYKQSSFDDILVADLKEDKYVYAGGSAGAVIVCKDLAYYINPDDDPTETPKGYDTWPIMDGLGIIREYIVPHYDTDWFGPYAKQAVREITKAGKKAIKLRDSDGLLVHGRRVELLRKAKK
ncbi:MAG: peptidase E [Candidatus Nomurabacteria bacterium]|jgi:dipeptidase E|nr:peptidase E [Candidatus Nomurabacteria bacterium]